MISSWCGVIRVAQILVLGAGSRADARGRDDSASGATGSVRSECTLVLAPEAGEVGGALGEQVAVLGLAFAVEQAPARGLEIEQQLAPGRIADVAAHPADGCE